MTSERFNDFWRVMDPAGEERARFIPSGLLERRRRTEAEALFSFALWWVRNETPADCARRAVFGVAS